MKRTKEMFNYLNEFCGESITSKLFSLKTNETTQAKTHELSDINSFKKLEDILEKYIEYKKSKVFVSEKEIEPIQKVLKELKEEIWDQKLMTQLQTLSHSTARDSRPDCRSHLEHLVNPSQRAGITQEKTLGKDPLQSLSTLKTKALTRSAPKPLSKTQKIMKNFYQYVHQERRRGPDEREAEGPPEQRRESKRETSGSVLNQGFPIFEIKSKTENRRQSLEDVLHKRDFVQFVNDTPKKSKKGSKYILSPYHSLALTKGRNEELLDDLFHNE